MIISQKFGISTCNFCRKRLEVVKIFRKNTYHVFCWTLNNTQPRESWTPRPSFTWSFEIRSVCVDCTWREHCRQKDKIWNTVTFFPFKIDTDNKSAWLSWDDNLIDSSSSFVTRHNELNMSFGLEPTNHQKSNRESATKFMFVARKEQRKCRFLLHRNKTSSKFCEKKYFVTKKWKACKNSETLLTLQSSYQSERYSKHCTRRKSEMNVCFSLFVFRSTGMSPHQPQPFVGWPQCAVLFKRSSCIEFFVL